MGKSTISIAIFSSFLYVYQRLSKKNGDLTMKSADLTVKTRHFMGFDGNTWWNQWTTMDKYGKMMENGDVTSKKDQQGWFIFLIHPSNI